MPSSHEQEGQQYNLSRAGTLEFRHYFRNPRKAFQRAQEDLALLEEWKDSQPEQPFGQVLLTAIALGIAAYGLFCFARARYARM